MEIVAAAKADQSHEDLLPTRLHYFVRAQDGLHLCLHKQCPGRRNGKPAFFVSRKNDSETSEGNCPYCYKEGRISKLVEIVACRKCGYLYGALQDLGPRRAQNPDSEGEIKPYFDSFSTELGWMADSYWSYFSVEDDLPYPAQSSSDEEEEYQDDLFLHPAELQWCVVCGKKSDNGADDNCDSERTCERPHLRTIKIFHRQCSYTGKAKDHDNLYSQKKTLLTKCPNCNARSTGLEPVHRFQESDDAIGLAMAIPLAHFEVSPKKGTNKPIRKLLCFTDHRQRAAAFPSLLEEETFGHDMGRKILEIFDGEKKPLDLISLGEALSDIADTQSDNNDPAFFLPTSRLPDEEQDPSQTKNLWVAETFAYFGIPDAARESVEDLGLAAVEYHLKDSEGTDFHRHLGATGLTVDESTALLQTLLRNMRHGKAFTLPKGRVEPDAPAFGRVTADIGYLLRREGINNTKGWLPHENRDNPITNYLHRLFSIPRADTIDLADKIWTFLTMNALLIEKKGMWKLDHERLFVKQSASRYLCSRCGIVIAYSVKSCCPRKGCDGRLETRPFNPEQENIIARWVSGKDKLRFSTLKSEEHTAQIKKDLAKSIEDEFKANGVNLLSSTTTFEMGINIGDLQKVLLRNAPPSSANYIQRVGRAGRGNDKNAVSVTLCRRTKYDADMWNDPPRLMSGEVRTPTVFIENQIIAQRHFNAMVFAKFLRIKIMDERVISQVKQQIPLELFLPTETRTDIPEDWVRHKNLFFDFPNWVTQQQDKDIFRTEAGKSLLTAIGSFESGKTKARERYEKVIINISGELSALMVERKKLFSLGVHTSDIEKAIKNLLREDIIAVLARRGFLPRYAFPLDVVTLGFPICRATGF